jgi:hypothetical protein
LRDLEDGSQVACESLAGGGQCESPVWPSAPERGADDGLKLPDLEIADDFAAEVAELCAISVPDRDWAAFLDAHAALPEDKGPGRASAERKRETLTELYARDERVAPWRGTAWGVLQAVNTYKHHKAAVRGAGRAERNMLNAVTGRTDDLGRETLQTLRTVQNRAEVALAA